MKIVIYLSKAFTLLILTFFFFVLYLKDQSSSMIFLIAGAVTLIMLLVYSIFFFSKLNKNVTKQAATNIYHVRQSYSTQPEVIQPVQVDPDCAANIKIGKDYYQGKVLPKDFAKAFNYLFDGATNGDSECQMLIGKMFLFGQGVNQNSLNAQLWLEVAAFQGNKEAEYLIGKMYSSLDNKEDRIRAVYFLRRASDQGHQEAKLHLRKFIENNSDVQEIAKIVIDSDTCFNISSNPYIKSLITRNIDNLKKITSSQVSKAFKILRLQPTSDIQVIKKSFLNLMLEYHPDHSSSNETDKIVAIRNAYLLLRKYFENQNNIDLG